MIAWHRKCFLSLHMVMTVFRSNIINQRLMVTMSKPPKESTQVTIRRWDGQTAPRMTFSSKVLGYRHGRKETLPLRYSFGEKGW